jgi:hypothetical protein
MANGQRSCLLGDRRGRRSDVGLSQIVRECVRWPARFEHDLPGGRLNQPRQFAMTIYRRRPSDEARLTRPTIRART